MICMRLVRQLWQVLAGSAALVFMAQPLAADSYRLVVGDEIALAFTTQGTVIEKLVDIDGQVRLQDLGGLTMAGLTLDEAEKLVEDTISDAGLYLDPRVSLSILSYAPVLVAGDVTRPGRFEFFPGMTIGAALALSGGTQAAGVSRFEIDRARTEVEGQLRTLNLEIAADVAQIGRLESLLLEKDGYVIGDTLLSAIPVPSAVGMEQLTNAQVQLLQVETQKQRDLLSFWAIEIGTLEEKQGIFSDRITLQGEIVLSVAKTLERAKELQDKGLQTGAQIATALQRDADARADALELETAKINLAQSLAETKRARAQFLANQREQALGALQTARVALDTKQLRYARALEHQALLTGGNTGTLMVSDAVALSFNIQSPRQRPEHQGALTHATPLLPGDTVIVTIDLVDLDPTN